MRRSTASHSDYLDAIGTEIGIEFTPHDLRRTAATWLADHAPGYIVKALLSHADPSRDADVTSGYVHFDVEALRPWLEQWEDCIYGA